MISSPSVAFHPPICTIQGKIYQGTGKHAQMFRVKCSMFKVGTVIFVETRLKDGEARAFPSRLQITADGQIDIRLEIDTSTVGAVRGHVVISSDMASFDIEAMFQTDIVPSPRILHSSTNLLDFGAIESGKSPRKSLIIANPLSQRVQWSMSSSSGLTEAKPSSGELDSLGKCKIIITCNGNDTDISEDRLIVTAFGENLQPTKALIINVTARSQNESQLSKISTASILNDRISEVPKLISENTQSLLETKPEPQILEFPLSTSQLVEYHGSCVYKTNKGYWFDFGSRTFHSDDLSSQSCLRTITIKNVSSHQVRLEFELLQNTDIDDKANEKHTHEGFEIQSSDIVMKPGKDISLKILQRYSKPGNQEAELRVCTKIMKQGAWEPLDEFESIRLTCSTILPQIHIPRILLKRSTEKKWIEIENRGYRSCKVKCRSPDYIFSNNNIELLPQKIFYLGMTPKLTLKPSKLYVCCNNCSTSVHEIEVAE